MELRHLRYLVALAEEASFTRAARKVHVTQSTLSHQIRQIEEEVGRPLFDRLGRRVVITEAGDELLHSATRALKEVDEAVRRLKSAPGPLTGQLRVGATHTFNIKVVPECLAAFFAQHPSVSVVVREMFATEVVELVESGELDLGITYEPHRGRHLEFEPLYVEEMILAVGSQHPWAARKRVRLVELHRQPVILPTARSSTRRIIQAALASVGAEPVAVAELDSVAASVELARRTGLGAIISRLATPHASDLHILALENPTPLRTPGLLSRTGEPPSAALRSFIGVLRRTVLQHMAPVRRGAHAIDATTRSRRGSGRRRD
jgi:LysR family cyn operon transcriptional activator